MGGRKTYEHQPKRETSEEDQEGVETEKGSQTEGRETSEHQLERETSEENKEGAETEGGAKRREGKHVNINQRDTSE